MTTDRYTKVVLTVIALSLSVIAIQLSTKNAQAAQQSFRFTEEGLLKIVICGPSRQCNDFRGSYY